MQLVILLTYVVVFNVEKQDNNEILAKGGIFQYSFNSGINKVFEYLNYDLKSGKYLQLKNNNYAGMNIIVFPEIKHYLENILSDIGSIDSKYNGLEKYYFVLIVASEFITCSIKYLSDKIHDVKYLENTFLPHRIEEEPKCKFYLSFLKAVVQKFLIIISGKLRLNSIRKSDFILGVNELLYKKFQTAFKIKWGRTLMKYV